MGFFDTRKTDVIVFSFSKEEAEIISVACEVYAVIISGHSQKGINIAFNEIEISTQGKRDLNKSISKCEDPKAEAALKISESIKTRLSNLQGK